MGSSVKHAITCLKDQATQEVDTVYHLKLFLDKFAKRVINFIRLNDQEILLMKNKVSRDLQTQERLNDDKIKAFKGLVDTQMINIEAKSETYLGQIKEQNKEIITKLKRVEDTQTIMNYMTDLIGKTENKFKTVLDKDKAALREEIKDVVS